MNLYVSTYLFAGVLLALGAPFAFFAESSKTPAFGFLRSTKAAVATFGTGGLWFLYSLSNLGESDFGNIKIALIAMFGVAGILAFFYLDDFLSVRGLAVIGLMLSAEFLDSAYMKDPPSRLFLVSFTYVMVLLSLYFGAVPYRLRDLLEWLYGRPSRIRVFGLSLCACAAILLAASLFY